MSMANTKTANIDKLNPVNHAKGVQVFRKDKVVDMSPAFRSMDVVYRLLAHGCSLTLRALGDDGFLLGGNRVKSVVVKGGPVLVLSDGEAYEVVEPGATVSTVSSPSGEATQAAFDLDVYEMKLTTCELIKDVDALEKSAREVTAGDVLAKAKALAGARREQIRK